jgi:hypothetical protein
LDIFVVFILVIIFCLLNATNGLRDEHVTGLGALAYQNTPKHDVRMKAK